MLKQLSDVELKNKYNFEIIVSDGGSSDGTVEIAKDFADVVVESNPREKQNISVGRNKGAAVAKGETFVFLNADVQLRNVNEFFHFLTEFHSNKKLAGATCKVQITPEESSFADKIFMSFYNFYFHFLNLIKVGMGRGECQAIRKEYFNKLNGYNENLPAGEDFDLFRKLRKIGKIYFSRRTVVYESPRRYRRIGHFKVFLTWTLNGLFVILKNKSLSNKWEQIR